MRQIILTVSKRGILFVFFSNYFVRMSKIKTFFAPRLRSPVVGASVQDTLRGTFHKHLGASSQSKSN